MTSRGTSLRRVLVHGLRVGLFALIILAVHMQSQQVSRGLVDAPPLSISDVTNLFPLASSLGEGNDNGAIEVLDAEGSLLGHCLQTSPKSDHIIGFSGPTNVLLGIDQGDRIVGAKILASGDTRDHVEEVERDTSFMASFDGLTVGEIKVDAVSGATLTSLAICESIVFRLSGEKASLRFTEPIKVSDIQDLFPTSDRIEPVTDIESRFRVFSGDAVLGELIRTSPSSDNVIGYQGPTDSWIGLDTESKVIGIVVARSYDNEPYVGYVREDDYFRGSFNAMSLESIAEFDFETMNVEGVSGATMTSQAVAEGVVQAAKQQMMQSQRKPPASRGSYALEPHDLGTLVVIVLAFGIGFSSLRSHPRIRVAFQLILLLYLGLTTGNLLSQAMIVGWAKHGIPWRNASGLALLTIAAFASPIFTKRNLYCSHLCPHGAAQQLLKRRIRYQVKLKESTTRFLSLVPGLLLLWCLVVAMLGLATSLVDIEPFDAYLFQIAGWATIAVAIVGLIASLFVPMAYCRFGCPTGKLLDFLRFNAKSDRWTIRDWIATAYFLFALVVWLL